MSKKRRTELAASRGLNAEALRNSLLEPNVPVLCKVAPPTETKYEFAKQCWLEYLSFLGRSESGSILRPGAIQPTTQTLKSFMMWTCLLNWRNFRRMFARCTGKGIDKDTAEDVRSYILGPLRQKLGIKHETRLQGYADEVDLEVLITYLWCQDHYEYKHDRYRVQLAFLVLLFFYTGARCGSFTGKFEYQDLNFAYRNMEVAIALSNNVPTVCLKVNQDNMKGKKGTPQFVDVILKERKVMAQCPVVAFLALAFADDAFQDISTPEELFSLRIPEGEDRLPVPWKQEMQDIPILKQETKGGNIKPLSRGAFESQLAELSIRAGYEISVKPHYIRRGVANRVDKHATAAERNHLFGHHNSSVYQKDYISSISNIDVQGAILDNATQDDHIQSFRRISRHKNPVSRLSLETKVTLLDRSDLKELKRQICDNSDNKAMTRTLKMRYESLKRTIFRDALEKEKDEWFRVWNSHEISHQLNGNGKGNDGHGILSRASLDAVKICMLRQLCSNRRLVADTCILGGINLWKDQSVLYPLIRLCSEDSQVQYYPGETPVEGRCPKCHMDMKSVSIPHRPHHIHRCFQNSLRSPGWLPQYCYNHAQWFTNGADWENHCRIHLLNMDIFCGIVTFRGITGIAGRCPFCMSNFPENLPARRFQEFTTSQGFTSHLRKHVDQIRDYQGTIGCPHISCNQDCSSVVKLLHHFYDVHGIDEAEVLLNCSTGSTNEPSPVARSTSSRPKLHLNNNLIADAPTSKTGPLTLPLDDHQSRATLSDPTSPLVNLNSSSLGEEKKRKTSDLDQTAVIPRKRRKYQQDLIGKPKILPTGELLGGKEYICTTFTLPSYGPDIFMIALKLRQGLGYSHSSCLFSNPWDPRPTLVGRTAVRYLKDKSLLHQAYRPQKLSVVKAFDMFRKFGHRVVLNGVPVTDDYYTAYSSPAIAPNLADSSLSIPGTACFDLLEWNPWCPSIEEAALPDTSARKTKPQKPSSSEEMENRNRVIRLHTGCVKNSKVVITID
ncbi:MAG: hypothetical protein M1839_008572 [Geoglossum umbratile]|nr:MAG: hypothetical protein M1839_008572 [Geoglossum umbratile]